MDPRLLEYYNNELAYMRELAQEFAEQHPKIASRLGMNGIEVADPYVERLLQGFSFLTARLQLKMDAQFPRFSQHLLEALYPSYLALTPSMAVVELQPKMEEGSLSAGFQVPRNSALLAGRPKGVDTACEFRTAHDVMLWPLTIAEVSCTGAPSDLPLKELPLESPVKGAIRIRLRAMRGMLSELNLEQLTFYLAGEDGIASRLHEIIFAHALGVVGCGMQRPVKRSAYLEPAVILQEGFEREQAMLPFDDRAFHGYRLLHEYFAFPNRFRFFTLTGLKKIVAQSSGESLDLTILLDCPVGDLETQVDKKQLALFCTPIVNLFPKRGSALEIDPQHHRHPIAADKTKPQDFEIYSIGSITGHGKKGSKDHSFQSFHAALGSGDGGKGAYYSMHREPHRQADASQHKSVDARYAGSEVFVSLIDHHQAHFNHASQNISVEMLCTNRGLASAIPSGGASDFDMTESVPVDCVKMLHGPTEAKKALAEGAMTWRIISHLDVNYLTLTDLNTEEGAQALRELLSIYGALASFSVRKQIDAMHGIRLNAVTRRLPADGQILLGRGVGIDLIVDEALLDGVSPYLLGAVLEQFFPRHVSQNAFTVTALHSLQRGEIARWALRMGKRPIA